MSKQIGLFKGETQNNAAATSKGCALLVEDDPVLRMMLRNMLETEGYEVAEAESRPDALNKLTQQQQIAVAIVDLGLPPVEHTTLERLALIRTMSAEYQHIKIIV